MGNLHHTLVKAPLPCQLHMDMWQGLAGSFGAAALGNNELRPRALLLEATVLHGGPSTPIDILGAGNTSITSGSGPPID